MESGKILILFTQLNNWHKFIFIPIIVWDDVSPQKE